jgi:peroxiredoxin
MSLAATAAGLPIGTVAPDFTLPDQHLTPVRLDSFRGRHVLLVFYPWSFTTVCSGELRALRDAGLASEEVQLLAVSCDAPATQRVFAERDGLDFPVLSDFWPHGAVAQKYGVFNDELGAALRGSFVIDRDGMVRWRVLNDVSHARDVSEYRRVLSTL